MRDRPTPRARLKRAALLTSVATFPAMAMVMMNTGTAAAHGAPMDPGSRTYLCYVHSLGDTGAIEPTNAACQAALDQGGHNAYYNWFAVLQSDGQGRTEGFIPDGELCSGASGAFDFSGFDLPRDDWPYTRLTSGAEHDFSYNVWAHHPGSFHLYVTKDGYDPTQPLTWDDIEDEPFDSIDDPPWTGVGSIEDEYYWTSTLPEDKEGEHIIYTVWERSDSPETFYSCSDVVFDGGNGEVVVPGVDSAAPASAALVEEFTAEPDLGDHAHHHTHTNEAHPVVAAAQQAIGSLLGSAWR